MRPDQARRATLALALALLVAPAARAQQPAEVPSDDLAAEVEELRRGQEEIRREIGELRELLEQRRAPAPAPPPRPAAPDVAGKLFDLGDNPVEGAPRARLTLIEFTDYQ